IPLAQHAQVWAEVTRPNGSTTPVAMPESADAQFAASYTTSAPGVYRLRVRANGTTFAGEPFTREKTLTAAVWRGGDHTTDSGGSGQVIIDYLRERDERLCELLQCVLKRDGTITAELEQRLRAIGIDVDRLRKCLAGFCKRAHR